ncbi:hypothetical protein B4Q04_08925 [Zobellia sp. OII3]|nr:hypothetical protein B4Q04_08925 [Zobellia sp. OII3]
MVPRDELLTMGDKPPLALRHAHGEILFLFFGLRLPLQSLALSLPKWGNLLRPFTYAPIHGMLT